MKQEELASLIETALRYFCVEEATEARIEEQLIADGTSPELARQLVVFVPAAFGRALLQRFSPEFPDTFLLMAEDGMYQRLFLANEPVFTAAFATAAALIKTEAWSARHQTAAGWSAEVHIAHSLSQKGNSPAGIWFTEAIVTSDIGPRGPSVSHVPVYPHRPARQAGLPALQPPEQPTHQPRPWWKLWG